VPDVAARPTQEANRDAVAADKETLASGAIARATRAWSPLLADLAKAVRGSGSPTGARSALDRWAARAASSTAVRDSIRDELVRADLAGRSHAARVDAGAAPVKLSRSSGGIWLLREQVDVGVEVPFTEAIEQYRAQGLLDDSLYAELLDDASEQAATSAQGAAGTLADRVYRSLLSTLEEGGTIDDFARSLSRGDAEQLGATYAETFFRTALSQAYTSGRVEQMEAPELQAAMPYVQLAAIVDSRTTSICLYLDGLTFDRTRDPGWSRYAPPNHYNCRTDINYLTESELDRSRLVRSDQIDARGQPQPPFDTLKA
jgi:SPP1 gp7 family putative phage head morphogenesis protein